MKNLIIPIEIKHRELQGAIVLAYIALKRGWTVYLGQKSQIFPFIQFFSKSIWFLKSIVPGELSNLLKIKSSDHKITTLDVEGLILSNGKFGAIKRYSLATIKEADIIFFWGDKSHYEPVAKVFPSIKHKSIISGSPIIDGWHYEKLNFLNQTKSTDNFKKTILISVNFARADPKFKYARKVYEKFYSGFDNYKKNELDSYNNLIEAEYKLKEVSFLHFKDIIPKISKKFSECRIIVRPHPEENLDFWKKYLSTYKNVIIENQKSTSSQLLISDIFIHFNSTMSIQSCYFDKITLMFNPIKETSLNDAISPITQDVSIICKDVKELFKNIANPDHKIMKTKKKKIKNYIRYLDNNNNLLSSELIINQIDKINIKTNNSKNRLNSIYSIIYFINFNLKFFILFCLGSLSIIIPFFRKRFERFRWRYVLGKKKWDKTSKKYIFDYFFSLIKDKEFQNKLVIKKHFGGFFILKLDK